MNFCPSPALWAKISKSYWIAWLSLGTLHSSPARADRILDLHFWSADQSDLALGGLWEFHAQELLEPAQRAAGSEVLLDISQPWRDFQPMTNEDRKPLERGSYVMLLKGFVPHELGYAIHIASQQSMTRVIAAPKYAPERSRRVQTEGFFAFFPLLRPLFGPRLSLAFFPSTPDEIWVIIIQRWQTSPDTAGAIPRLEFTKKSH